MKNTKLGFTLIELLAVVLIIGILAAIAMPQYRRSVDRAEVMEAMMTLRTVFDSAKRYKAANSAAPLMLQGLDVYFPSTTMDATTFTVNKFNYTFSNDTIAACRINGNYCLYMYYNHPTKGKDTLTCKLESTGGKYDWMCETIGTVNLGENEYQITK